MTGKEKELVKNLKKVTSAVTFGLYCIHRPHVKNWRYTPPFFAPTDEYAFKALVDEARKHPELSKCYILKVAIWNSETGKVRAFVNPKIVNGVNK